MKPPFAVVFLGCLFVVAGGAGLVYQFGEPFTWPWSAVIAAISILAIVGGIFLIKGRNWARWTLIGWLAFHVFVSAFHSVSNALAHLTLLLVIGYVLLTQPVSGYFIEARGSGKSD